MTFRKIWREPTPKKELLEDKNSSIDANQNPPNISEPKLSFGTVSSDVKVVKDAIKCDIQPTKILTYI